MTITGPTLTPAILDLFCGAGGATLGYKRAGFWVRGVDIEPQPYYPGDAFTQADALEYLDELCHSSPRTVCDAIHASPPYTDFGEIIAETRTLLEESGLPYVLEGYEGAPLVDPVHLGDDGFFEANWPLVPELIVPILWDGADLTIEEASVLTPPAYTAEVGRQLRAHLSRSLTP